MFKLPYFLFNFVTSFFIIAIVSVNVPQSLMAQQALSEKERASVQELVAKLPTLEFRKELGIGGVPSDTHIVANYNDSSDVALSKFFASYGTVPANTRIMLRYYSGNHQNHILYWCPSNLGPCTQESIEEVSGFDPETAYQINDVRGGMVFPASGGKDRLSIDLPTDRKGRLAANFSYEIGTQQNDLRHICMGLEFYPKGFFGEKDPVDQGLYCYNFAMKMFVTDFAEFTYGYILSEESRVQLRRDAKDILGIDPFND